MTIPFGGETSLAGFTQGILTVEPPDGTTAANPVLPGQLFKLAIAGDTATDLSGYKLIPCVDGDTTADSELVEALERCIGTQMSVVRLCVPGQTRTLPYLVAELPVVGKSVQISATVTMVGDIAWARGKGTVMSVDTTTQTCEVLF